jgi:putative endonuclease
MPSYVYILSSQTAGTLYTGVTSDLAKHVSQHKLKITKGFTSRYKVDRLVWYEVHSDIENAIQREKQIKEWQRKRKIQMIEKTNPEWKNLFNEVAS